MRLIDWIWHVRGSLPLDPAQSHEDTLNKLDVVFREKGTTYTRSGDKLTFHKKDPLSQDKMATFDSGSLQVVDSPSGSELHYDLRSRALLFCFLAPLLFLTIAWTLDGVRTQGYVFAGLFVLLYIGGRLLEPRLVRALFQKNVFGSCDNPGPQKLA